MTQGLPPGFVLDTAPPAARPVNNDPIVKAREPEKPEKPEKTWTPSVVNGKPVLVASDGDIKDMPGSSDSKPTEYQSKSAGFLGRMLRAEQQYGTVPSDSRDARTPVGQWFHNALPDVDAVFNSSDRNSADNAARDFISASLRQESGAAIGAEEFANQYRIFFPMPGDTEQQIKEKAVARKQAIEGFKIAAGPLLEQTLATVQAPVQRGDQKQPTVEMRGGLPVGTNVQFGGNSDPFDRAGYVQKTYGITPEQEDLIIGFFNQNRRNEALTPESAAAWYQQNGIPVPAPEALASMVDSARKGFAFAGVDTSQAKAAFDAEAQKIADERAKTEGQPGAGDLARQGLTLNLGDEAAGVGGAIGALLTGNDVVGAYNRENRAEDLRLEQAKKNAGWTGTAAEFLGALSSGGLAAGGTTTVRQAAGQGATLGGLYGFGSGEGFAGSATNALLGVTLGGGAGAGGQMAANKIGNVVAARQANNAPIQQRGAEVAAAGQVEGVTVNRAMVDPSLENRVTGVDASMVGGPRFQRGMNEIENQVENRVTALGQGGQPLEPVALGQMSQDASERFIKQSGKATKAKYDAAVREAGDTKVEPRQSLKLLDDLIGQMGGQKATGLVDASGNPIVREVSGAGLSELSKTNSAEIAFLSGLREDLSKNLSVGALRDLRTTLRKKISKGELTFGQNEARVLEIMGAAADDIRTGLQAAGKGKAAKMFDLADKEYAERMQFIQGTLQKIIGKRESNFSAEQIARNLSGMARGKDSEGVRSFLQKLTPDELADVRATFAEALGKNAKDQFTVTQFLRQTSSKNFPEGALKVVFGDEGAASIKRLRLLGEEIERVTGAMNSRKSGTAVGNDYRSWLFNALVGLIPGAGQGSTMGALAGAATAMGVKAGRDVMSARALLSSDISKWIASAPRTTNPQAINAHIAKLSGIAAGNSAVRMDAKAIEEYLKSVAGSMAQSPGRAAAQDEAPSGGEPPQQ